MPKPPPGAFEPGTKLTVGSHDVVIKKYISEGGFAVVYTCSILPPFNGVTTACLKRVIVPHKWQLNLLRQEVDAMRRLRGNTHIVSYIDSHASRFKTPQTPEIDQQYEVLLLMEYCLKNGLIDFMNTRLVNKLNEREILQIMHDVTLGVAMCHHLQPPLIHRDIKIENVLIDEHHRYKLCDFGSTVPYIPPPRTANEIQSVREDIMQNTTPQYRAPEMIDLTKGFAIDDKLDVWALGCFLYKLCYYTTPFEMPNQASMQDLEKLILNSTNTLHFVDRPGLIFSARMKNIIRCCLRPNPQRRPNAVQLLQEVCAMLGRPLPNVIPASVRESKVLHDAASTINSNSANSLHSKADAANGIPNVSHRATRPMTTSDLKPSRPMSVYNPSVAVSENAPATPNSALKMKVSASTNQLQDYIQSQIEHSQIPDQIGSSSNTLDFLRSKELEVKLNLRQNTGQSIKSSIRNSLRRISTGGSAKSISAQSSGNDTFRQAPRGEKSRNVFSHRKSSPSPEVEVKSESKEVPKKLSIQRRMQQLFDSDKDADYKKTANGYGKYTDVGDDIASINNQGLDFLLPPKLPKSLSAHSSLEDSKPKLPSRRAVVQIDGKAMNGPKRTEPKGSVKVRESATRGLDSKKHEVDSKSPFSDTIASKATNTNSSTPKLTTSKSTISKGLESKEAELKKAVAAKKAPPVKPKKPVHLLSIDVTRRLSTGSDISIPDVDDLETHFAKRFPSYV